MADPVYIEGAERDGRWVVTVDHARNAVPAEVAQGDLGLSAADMARHIAYDIGALGLAQALAAKLSAPLVATTYSRLVIDPNRGEDDPTLVMQLYDGTIIPANRGITEAERAARVEQYYRPYHDAIEQLASARTDPVLLAIHSFTPQFQGRAPRPWHLGILYADDDRLARPLLSELRAEPDLCVGDNEPYRGSLSGDAMDQHGLRPGRIHVLLEVRNDLIVSAAQQLAWAARLVPILQRSLAQATGDSEGLFYGSSDPDRDRGTGISETSRASRQS